MWKSNSENRVVTCIIVSPGHHRTSQNLPAPRLQALEHVEHYYSRPKTNKAPNSVFVGVDTQKAPTTLKLVLVVQFHRAP